MAKAIIFEDQEDQVFLNIKLMLKNLVMVKL